VANAKAKGLDPSKLEGGPHRPPRDRPAGSRRPRRGAPQRRPGRIDERLHRPHRHPHPGQTVTPDNLSGGDNADCPPRKQPCQGTPDTAASPEPPANRPAARANRAGRRPARRGRRLYECQAILSTSICQVHLQPRHRIMAAMPADAACGMHDKMTGSLRLSMVPSKRSTERSSQRSDSAAFLTGVDHLDERVWLSAQRSDTNTGRRRDVFGAPRAPWRWPLLLQLGRGWPPVIIRSGPRAEPLRQGQRSLCRVARQRSLPMRGRLRQLRRSAIATR
jgi:hypothetical protein